MNPVLLLLIIPLLIVLLGLYPRSARWLPTAAAVLMLLQLGVVICWCWPSILHPVPVMTDFGVDGISAAFLIITTLVAAGALIQAAFLLPAEDDAAPGQLRQFYVLAGLFVLAMYGVLLAQNLGYLWIAMEATTLMSAPLVFYHRSRRSLEATWKYLLLCSVGIAFALFGTVLVVAAQHTLGHHGMLALGELKAHAAQLDPRLLRMGFIFCVLGYGTKAGLFPLHNWLPDAHSEAPAPASALLSGALLNCALVAIWRMTQVMNAAGQGDLVRQLLVPAGAITVLAASLMLLRQHDLKRLWAYSSVEHVGLLTLAIGIGSTNIFVLHALNHSLIKVALFLLAGAIIHLYGTKSLRKLGGLLHAAPVWGILLIAATFGIAGSPPFGTFISEWLLLRDAFVGGVWPAAVVVIIGLTVTFVALSMQLSRVVFGQAPLSMRIIPAISARALAVVPFILLFIALITGLAIAPPVMTTLTTLAKGGALLP